MFQVLASSRFKVRMWSTKSARFISTKSTTKWWVLNVGWESSFVDERGEHNFLSPSLSLSLRPSFILPRGRRGGIKRYLPSALRLRIRRRAELIFRIIEKGCRGYLHLTRTHATHTDIRERSRPSMWKTKSGFSKALRSGDHTGPTVIDNSLFVVYYQTNSCDVNQGFS